MAKGDPVPLPDNAPTIGGIYRHYKGDNYKVVGLALNSGDSGQSKDEWLVVYEPLYADAAAPMFARPLVEWHQPVQWQGAAVERFTKIG